MAPERVLLPAGLWRGGRHVREVGLRAISGEDEALLLETRDALLPARRASALLGRCVDADDPEAFVRSVAVGDREALLLHLRRLSFGDRLESVVACPGSGCG